MELPFLYSQYHYLRTFAITIAILYQIIHQHCNTKILGMIYLCIICIIYFTDTVGKGSTVITSSLFLSGAPGACLETVIVFLVSMFASL